MLFINMPYLRDDNQELRSMIKKTLLKKMQVLPGSANRIVSPVTNNIATSKQLITNPVSSTKDKKWLGCFGFDIFYSIFHYSGFWMIWYGISLNVQYFLLFFGIVWLGISIAHHICFIRCCNPNLFNVNTNDTELQEHFNNLKHTNATKLNQDLFIEDGVFDQTPELNQQIPTQLDVNFQIEIVFADDKSRIVYQAIIDGRQIQRQVASRTNRFYGNLVFLTAMEKINCKNLFFSFCQYFALIGSFHCGTDAQNGLLKSLRN